MQIKPFKRELPLKHVKEIVELMLDPSNIKVTARGIFRRRYVLITIVRPFVQITIRISPEPFKRFYFRLPSWVVEKYFSDSSITKLITK